MAYSDTKFEVATSNSLDGDTLTSKYIIWPLTLTQKVKVIQNIAQYPLHHVNYSGTKFKVATSNSLGADASTWKYII